MISSAIPKSIVRRSLALVFLASFLLAGCSGSDDRNTTATTSGNRVKISLLSPQPDATNTVEIDEGAGAVVFQFQLSEPLTKDFQFGYQALSNTASLNNDFMVSSEAGSSTTDRNTITIPKGNLTFNAYVSIVNDIVYEDNETFYVSFLVDSTVKDAISIENPLATVRIKDDEPYPTIELVPGSDLISVNESAGEGRVLVSTTSYSSNYDIKIPVQYSSVDGFPLAIAGEDYTVTNYIVVPRVEKSDVPLTPTYFRLLLNDDVIPEGTKYVKITLGTPVGANLGVTTSVKFQIVDDDTNSSTINRRATGIQNCTNGLSGNAGVSCPTAAFPFGQDGDRAAENAYYFETDPNKPETFTKLTSQGVLAGTGATSWNCVRDNFTGLVWEVKSADPATKNYHKFSYSWYNERTNSNGGNSGRRGVTPSTTNSSTVICSNISNCDTQTLIDAMNKDNYCGYSTWRLPRVDELLSLAQLSGSAHLLVKEAFEPTGVETRPDLLFWAATPVVGDPATAWSVRFHYNTGITAYPLTEAKSKDNELYVRLVTK